MSKRAVSNPYVSILKLIASIFIIFGHVKLPGVFGNVVECLFRFTVPTFFAISGYYSFRTEPGRLLKRAKKLLKIFLISSLFYLIWVVIEQNYLDPAGMKERLSSLLSIKNLAKLLFLDFYPLAPHLWFLTAEIKIYLGLYVYLTFTKDRFDYRPLYLAALSAFFVFIALGVNAETMKQNIDPYITRTSLFYGFPMFMLGLFLRNYQDVITANFRLTRKKLYLAMACGFLLAVIELLGVGKTELPLGHLATVTSLMLLVTVFPDFDSAVTQKLSRYSGIFETMSLVIYILHPLLIYSTSTFAIFSPIVQKSWLYPLLICLCSVLLALLYALLLKAFQKSQKGNNATYR